MKLLILTAALTVAASFAFAGSIAYVEVYNPGFIVPESGSMGGSGVWLLPLLAIALIFLVSNGSEQRGN